MMDSRRLVPEVTFAEIFGAETVYDSRPSPTLHAWLGDDAAVHDAMSGSHLSVVGAMPVLCSRGVTSPMGATLLREAGLSLPSRAHVFEDEDDYLLRLQQLSRGGHRVALQYLHAPDELPKGRCFSPAELLSFLNNKANMAELVPAAHLPRRRLAAPGNLRRHRGLLRDLPLVVKAVTDESTGGGLDVCICREPEDLRRAIPLFGACGQVVLEEYLEIRKNLCLNYAVWTDGRLRYLGCAEQVCGPDGRYHGNWIDPDSAAPHEAVALGEAIVKRAAAMGYRGVVGIDVAQLDDGRLLVFDLNFRVNGSTPGILLHDSVVQTRGHDVVRLRAFHASGSLHDFTAVLRRATLDGMLVPLYLYDPVAGGRTSARARCAAMLLGRSREDVRRKEQALAALGVR